MRSVTFSRPLAFRLLALGAALVTFGFLAEDARSRELMSWDFPVARYVHGLDDRALDQVFRFFTIVGGGYGLLLVASAVVVGLIVHRRLRSAAFVGLAVLGAPLLSGALKQAFGRPRPGLSDSGDRLLLHGAQRELLIAAAVIAVIALVARRPRYALVAPVYLLALGVSMLVGLTSSPVSGLDAFPSGHATGSFALATAVAVLAWPTRWRLAVIAGGALFVVAVGLSRLYLGVHFPSDILAGWCVALAWVALLRIAFSRVLPTLSELSPRRLLRRRSVRVSS